MKTLKRIIPVVVVVLVLAVGAMSALASSTNFDTVLLGGGTHMTLATGTKSSSSSFAQLTCQTQNNYTIYVWIDGTHGQATDSITCRTGSKGLEYSRYIPAVSSSVSLRGSTDGMFAAPMWASGHINFN